MLCLFYLSISLESAKSMTEINSTVDARHLLTAFGHLHLQQRTILQWTKQSIEQVFGRGLLLLAQR